MSGDQFAIPAALMRYFDLATRPYSKTADDIKARRKELPNGKLFFDQLLGMGGIDGPAQYPPSSPGQFRRLLHAIHTAPVNRLQRDCFLYYMLCDADADELPSTNGAMEVDGDGASSSGSSNHASRAKAFARRRCLPQVWQVYMNGYWALDHGNWEAGVQALCDPSITAVDSISDIVTALTTLVSPPARALQLVHALRLGERPSSTETTKDAELLAAASVAGMADAFAHIRALADEEARHRAREAVWCWSLGAPRSPAGKGEHTAQPRALRELLHLALSDEEQSQLVALLAHPPRDIPTPARSLLHDLVTLRLIHAGQYEETLALDKELAATDAAAAADRQRRREIVREFIDILPEAQRRILLLGYDLSAPAVPNGKVPSPMDEDVNMSRSWVDEVPEEEPTAPVIAAPTPIRPQAVRNLQASVAAPGTPARTSSPFGGPPRFAVSSPRAPSTQRQASPIRATKSPTPPAPVARERDTSPVHHIGSPFVAPPSTVRPTPRKQPKRIIQDEPAHSLRRSTRRAASSEPASDSDDVTPTKAKSHTPVMRAPSEAPIPEDEPMPAPTRHARRTPQPPAPAQKPARRSVRASSRASTADVSDDDEPAIPGGFTRARSASRAELPDPEPVNPPKKARAAKAAPVPRRTTRAMSEATDDGEAAPVRRTTRRAAAAASQRMSERGSPTPSVASTAGSPAKRRTKAGAAPTPRATRSKK